MSMDWKQKAGFLTPKAIGHEVGGKETLFWPVSVGKAARLRVIAAPVIEALTVVVGGFVDQTNTVVEREVPTEDGPGKEKITQAADGETIRISASIRAEAITKAINALMDERARAVVGELLIDSMRDVFGDMGDACPPAVEVANSLTLKELREAITGLAKANAEVFGPFAQTAGAMIKRVLGMVDTALSGHEMGEVILDVAKQTAAAGTP